MPRTSPPRRAHVACRIGEAGLTAVDALAKDEGVDRSEMLRRLIREAVQARHERGKE